MLLSSLQLLSEIFPILKIIERDTIKNSVLVFMYRTRYYCHIPVKLILKPDSRKKKIFQISNFVKIRQVGAELFHANGRADRHDGTNTRFSQFY